jgi:hypothetical protein
MPPEKFTDTLLFGIVALDHDGKIKASMRGSYEYSATPKEAQNVTYAVNAPIELPSQPLTLRIAVASQALDRASSIHLPVEPLNLNRDQLQVGAIVLGFAGPPRQTAVPKNAFKDLVPFQPTVERAFSAADTLQIFAPLFWRGLDSATAVVGISVKRGDAVMKSTRTTVSGDGAGTGSRAQQATVSGNLSLNGLPAGDYVLEIEGRLTSGSIARRSVAFVIR